MFFVIEEWRCITLKPSQLGPRYEQSVQDALRLQVEGKCTPKNGYIICVIDFLEKLPGRIQESTGYILVDVKYQAVVFKPIKDEILDGVVIDVNKLGFFALCGPLKVFVGKNAIPPTYTFDDGAVIPRYTDSESIIKAQTEVRMKLLGSTYGSNNLFAIATINSHFLGPIDSEAGSANE